MSSVAIIGAGEIGGATAYALAINEWAGRVLLIDPSANAAAGKALDIRQSAGATTFHTVLEGAADPTKAVGSDVWVIADPISGDNRSLDEALLALRQVAGYAADAPLIFARADAGPVIKRLAVEARIPGRRLIGSAPHALTSAVRAIVAMEARCSPADVMVAVLGAAPGGIVVPWSEASIGGYAVQQLLPQVTLARIDARVRALWPPGPYGLGTAAAQAAHAVLVSSRRFVNVTTQLQGEFGARRTPGIVPARLGPAGVEEIRLPELTTRDRVLVQTALEA